MTEKPPREGKRPTIADVARAAGVAPAIVSRALSPSHRPVSLEKKERVLKVAAALGYHQNPLARGLATKSIDLVAVIINYLSDLSDLDLFDPLLEAIQSLGKQAILIRVGRTKRIDDFLRNSLSYHVHAALVFSDFADAGEVRALFHSDNVLMLNGRSDAESARIRVDEESGISELVRHARGRGVGSAVLVTGRASSLVEEARIIAYRTACTAAGIRLLSEARGDYSYGSGIKAAAAIAGAMPDAVFCTSDSMAMGVMDGLAREGRRPPANYLLYGFDAVENGNFAAYDISSVGFDRSALVTGIVAYLKAPAEFPAVGLDIPTRFIARSTG